MSSDLPGDRPGPQDDPPWAHPTDPSPGQSTGGGPGWTDAAGGPAQQPPAYTVAASPWETAGTAAGVPPYGFPPQRRTNTMAIVAMALSLVGIGCGVTAPVGAILGHVARRQLRQSGEDGDGFALTAIIVGWIITGVTVLACGAYAAIIGVAIWQAP